jgi:hypothetical protein
MFDNFRSILDCFVQLLLTHLKTTLQRVKLSSRSDYTSGELLTGFLKKELIDVLTPMIQEFQVSTWKNLFLFLSDEEAK